MTMILIVLIRDEVFMKNVGKFEGFLIIHKVRWCFLKKGHSFNEFWLIY